MSADSQEQAIWELLESRGEDWTPAPQLVQISLQYSRAIHSLRKRYGRDGIENRVEHHGRVKHGFFRLKPKTERPTSPLPPAPAPAPAQQSFDAGTVAPRPDDAISRSERARMRRRR